MNEPSARTLEFARKLLVYDPAVDPKQIVLAGNNFVYQTEAQAREGYDALIVKVAAFLEDFWLQTQVMAWNSALALKGEA